MDLEAYTRIWDRAAERLTQEAKAAYGDSQKQALYTAAALASAVAEASQFEQKTDEKVFFPIMKAWKLHSIPWRLIAPHEERAKRNHAQSLERLAERGGLNPTEALCVIEDRALEYPSKTDTVGAMADEAKLAKLVAEFGT